MAGGGSTGGPPQQHLQQACTGKHEQTEGTLSNHTEQSSCWCPTHSARCHAQQQQGIPTTVPGPGTCSDTTVSSRACTASLGYTCPLASTHAVLQTARGRGSDAAGGAYQQQQQGVPQL